MNSDLTCPPASPDRQVPTTASPDAVADLARARIGQVLNGKWRIDSLLGIGGMAFVYAATHRNGNRAAIKLLRPERAKDPKVYARFVREGYVANLVGHPGTVSVLDDDCSGREVFLVMELLDGESLDNQLLRHRTFSVNEVLNIGEQVLDVLIAAHAKGIVHRDIKPENVFLMKDGGIKILDYGIARLHERTAHADDTQSGMVMGTPAFMAPEQAQGRWDEVDAQSDLWAVGATMYTLLTGHNLREAETPNQSLAQAMNVPVPAMRSLVPELPEVVGKLIDRALAFDKSVRWRDAATMLRAVRETRFALGDTWVAPPKTPPGESLSPQSWSGRPAAARRRRLGAAWLATAAGVFGILVGAVVGLQRLDATPTARASIEASAPPPPVAGNIGLEAEGPTPKVEPPGTATSTPPAPPQTALPVVTGPAQASGSPPADPPRTTRPVKAPRGAGPAKTRPSAPPQDVPAAKSPGGDDPLERRN